MKYLFMITLICLAIVACKDRAPEVQNSTPAPPPAIDYAATDKWLGQWNGPEGTFLKISGGAGKYEIVIQNLDGPTTYSGISLDGAIQFERNGILEKIRATNGEATGMKWLSEKQDCLTINRGEGFCKD